MDWYRQVFVNINWTFSSIIVCLELKIERVTIQKFVQFIVNQIYTFFINYYSYWKMFVNPLKFENLNFAVLCYVNRTLMSMFSLVDSSGAATREYLRPASRGDFRPYICMTDTRPSDNDRLPFNC